MSGAHTRLRQLGGLLACSAALAAGAAEPVPRAADVQADASYVARLALPPVPPTREVIAALPQVQAAGAGRAYAEARGERLQAGIYEWTVKAGVQRRSESNGPQYTEGEFALERPIRWGGKAQTDRDLGAAGVAAAQSGYTDAWHEAVRGLIRAWYEWQRARGAVQVQMEQAALAQEQRAVAERRVKAGDAPRLDQLMAQAEHDRVMAQLQQAQGQEEVLRQALRKHYPGLAIEGADTGQPDVTPEALRLPGEPQAWVRRILADNHEIELAEDEVRVARLQSERARLDTRPDPLFGVRAARERGGQENIFGAYVAIPLSGAYREADQRAALAQLAAAEQRLSLVRQRVEADAQRVVLQAGQTQAVWQRLAAVEQAMAEVARLGTRAYGLGEMSLTEALQARRTALEAALAAQGVRWDAMEAASRVLVDAHQIWAADEEHGQH